MPDEVIEQTAAPASAPAASPAPAPAATSAPSPAATPAASPAASPASAPAASQAAAPAPEDWRAKAISQVFGEEKPEDVPETKAEREKLAKLAARYNTPGDALKALREAQVKISSGQLKAPLPANAKPEEIAAWRKENGIPETADKYDTGLKLDEMLPGSQKLVSMMVEQAHAANASPEAVKAIAAAVPKFEQAMAAEVERVNSEAKAEAIETLRADWGPDYKSNMDGMLSMLNGFPSAASEAIINARIDGVQILNIPEVVKALAGHARELGYVGATVVPSGGDISKSIDDEIEGLKTKMHKDLDAWRKDSKGQARYMQLIEAQNRNNARK